MKLYLAADHAGFALKNILAEQLPVLGHVVDDCGAYDLDPDDDYPGYVSVLVASLQKDPQSFGIICAGSGQGEAMAANRAKGIRAAVFYGQSLIKEIQKGEGEYQQDGYDIVRLARKHNNANVLSIGARFVSREEADEAVQIFLATPFDAQERHIRRLEKF